MEIVLPRRRAETKAEEGGKLRPPPPTAFATAPARRSSVWLRAKPSCRGSNGASALTVVMRRAQGVTRTSDAMLSAQGATRASDAIKRRFSSLSSEFNRIMAFWLHGRNNHWNYWRA